MTEPTVDAYSKGYIANKEIDIDGVRAFNRTHQVPDQHVEDGIVSRDDVIQSPSASEMTVAQLKVQLEALGQPTEGNKAELQARLQGAAAAG